MYPIEYTWTSMPIVVTTTSSTDVRLSTRNPNSTLKSPAEIHVQIGTLSAPSSPSTTPWNVAMTYIAASHAPMTAATGIQNALAPSRRPTIAVVRKPASGSATIRITRICWRFIGPRSSAHRVVLVDERGLAVAEDRDDDREADRGLGRGNRDDHQRDDGAVPLERRDERAEGDDREVDRVEHQLDRHEHGDRVPAGEEPERADGEQQAGQREVRVEL